MTTPAPGHIVTQCPKCTALVYLPSIVSTRTMVRCPKCQSQYTLASILPPDVQELQVIQGAESLEMQQEPSANESKEGQTEPTIIDSKFEVPSILRYGARRRKHSRSEAAEVNVETEPATGDVTPGDVSISSTEQPRSSSGRSGHRRSRHSRSQRYAFETQPNSALEMVKVVIGAMMALPVAQLIIWWGLGLDPLGLGPRVGKLFPPLVPKAIRVADEATGRSVDLRNATTNATSK